MKPEIKEALARFERAWAEADLGHKSGSAIHAADGRALVIIRSALEHGAFLDDLVNNPETEDFLLGVKLEAAHQVQRWGEAHDRGKSAENWFWLVGYLAGKCLRACITGDRTKALHHTISASAALLNWHAAIKRDTTGCGIGQDDDIRPVEIARFEQSDRDHAYLGGSGHGSTIPI